jgi:hypothetical protein
VFFFARDRAVEFLTVGFLAGPWGLAAPALARLALGFGAGAEAGCGSDGAG